MFGNKILFACFLYSVCAIPTVVFELAHVCDSDIEVSTRVSCTFQGDGEYTPSRHYGQLQEIEFNRWTPHSKLIINEYLPNLRRIRIESTDNINSSICSTITFERSHLPVMILTRDKFNVTCKVQASTDTTEAMTPSQAATVATSAQLTRINTRAQAATSAQLTRINTRAQAATSAQLTRINTRAQAATSAQLTRINTRAQAAASTQLVTSTKITSTQLTTSTNPYYEAVIGVSGAAGLCLLTLVIVITAIKCKLIRLKRLGLGPVRLTFNTSTNTTTTNTTMTRSMSEPILFTPELYSTTVESNQTSDQDTHAGPDSETLSESPIAHRLRSRF